MTTTASALETPLFAAAATEVVPFGEHVRIELAGAVGVLVLDRRARMNSFDVATAREFRRAGLRLARDEAVRAVVVAGAGGVFSTGADLKYIRAGGDRVELAYLHPESREVPPGYGEIFKQILEYLHSTISEIVRAPKPVVAAVDGMAAAGGFGIAMACDLVLASDRAAFEWAYGKTGLTGAESSTFFLPRLVGYRRAMELVLLNPRLDAAAAREMGLVNAVLPAAGFAAAVMEVAARLAAGPTRAYGVAKGLVQRGAGVERLDPHLDRELEELARATDGPDFAEGLDAFFAKRPARFAGAG